MHCARRRYRATVAAAGLAGLLISGCYASHTRDDAPAIAPDSAPPPTDASIDSGWDAHVFVPPPGVCNPPVEYRTDRFPGDTQDFRDQQQASEALYRACSVGEGCAGGLVTVGEDGRVDSVEAPDDDTGCIEEALLGLCLPSVISIGAAEVIACGV